MSGRLVLSLEGLHPVNIIKVGGNLTRRQPRRRQQQLDLIDTLQATLPFGYKHGLDDLSRSLRISILTGSISVSTVLTRLPLRIFA